MCPNARKTGADPVTAIGAEDLDVELRRRETPGAGSVTHLNNAGAALMPTPVVHAMTAHLELETQRGGYEAAEIQEEALNRPYTAAAQILGCEPDDIAITDSATRAWSLAFYSIPFQPGDRILASSVEYGSNYLSLLHVARRAGAVVEVLPNDAFGRVDVAALRAMLDDRVKAVVMTHVPSHSGIVNPIAEIGAAVRTTGALYLVDACQSIGHLPIDVKKVGCDFLSACGRKYLRGPRGTGLLYMNPRAAENIDPLMVGLDGARWLGGSHYTIAPGAKRFETWEVNAVARLGLGAALTYALETGIETSWARIASLGRTLRRELHAIPGVELLERVDDEGDLAGIVGFTIDGHEPEEIRQAMRRSGINLWVSRSNTACVDMEDRKLEETLRASVHYYNTHTEIQHLTSALRDHLGAPRQHTGRPQQPCHLPA
ncbi:aminotransferase class V-fold PLP-dependent enzyme [Streptomyces sp. NPDC021098]|uniref:aminotransferase class V-fold PLP-dependent enzyme n=1 Tax=unclassified Streptomyces TaxID=2593676 RepID=UPI0037A09FD9